MPTREEALSELGEVFDMIAAEYGEKGLPLPADSTAIVNAWRPRSSVVPSGLVLNGAERVEAMSAGFITTGARSIPIRGGSEIGPPSTRSWRNHR
jgi:hypothetical protein